MSRVIFQTATINKGQHTADTYEETSHDEPMSGPFLFDICPAYGSSVLL